MMFIVTIVDKELPGEPDIGIAFVDADSEQAAIAMPEIVAALDQLREQNRCRVFARPRAIELGRVYRASMLVRPSMDQG